MQVACCLVEVDGDCGDQGCDTAPGSAGSTESLARVVSCSLSSLLYAVASSSSFIRIVHSRGLVTVLLIAKTVPNNPRDGTFEEWIKPG